MYQRKKLRLTGYDYSQSGYYFITICTKDRKKILCEIVSDREGDDGDIVPHIVPTKIGRIIIEHWNNMNFLSENVQTDQFCIMPDHIHGIIIIKNQEPNEIKKIYGFETGEKQGRRSIPGLIKGFKSATTRLYKGGELWQRSYHDHIIRSEGEYQRICAYIRNNPYQWLSKNNVDKGR